RAAYGAGRGCVRGVAAAWRGRPALRPGYCRSPLIRKELGGSSRRAGGVCAAHPACAGGAVGGWRAGDVVVLEPGQPRRLFRRGATRGGGCGTPFTRATAHRARARPPDRVSRGGIPEVPVRDGAAL